MKLSIIIPAYDEFNSIPEIIKRAQAEGIDKEIIIVDDFSTDGTREYLQKNIDSKFSDIKVLYHNKNLGKTAAIRTALKEITGDIVIIQDADLEYDPRDYKKIIEPIVNNSSKVVYGSRFVKINKYLFIWHWFINKIFKKQYEIKYLSHFLGIQFLNFLAFLLYGVKISDIATGYKAFKASVMKDISLYSNRFEFCYEITAKLAKKGFKIKEVSINYYPRSNLKGKKITWVDGIWASLELIKYKFRA